MQHLGMTVWLRQTLKQLGLKHSPHFLIKKQPTFFLFMLLFSGKIRAFLNQQRNISLHFQTAAILIYAIAAQFC